MTSLSNSEYEILELLCSEGRGLTAAEINNLSVNKSWTGTSIHLILNNMMEKGVIHVDGMVRSGRAYSRVFFASLTPEEFFVDQIGKNISFSKDKNVSIPKLFAALIDSSDIDAETICELEAILKKKKGEM